MLSRFSRSVCKVRVGGGNNVILRTALSLSALSLASSLSSTGASAASAGRRKSSSCAGKAPQVFSQLLNFPGLDGGSSITSASLSGKVVLLINTASYCGYTPQLQGLQTLYEQFKSDGFEVVAVPSNDFGQQEPDPEPKIASFYRGTYRATYIITGKTHVIGGEAHPAYLWFQRQLGDAGSPHWNFQKYLIDRNGDVIGLFEPGLDPLAPEIVAAVRHAIAEQPKQKKDTCSGKANGSASDGGAGAKGEL